jgi:chlorobactene lauroyltransferase
MIPAHKNWLGEEVFWHIARASMRRHFNTVRLRQRGRLAEDSGELPILILANHSSWWDGYFAWLVARTIGQHDHYLMMEEANLRRYRFFTWAGCFSVDREHGRAALESISYAAHLLKERPGRAIWIFPQGEIVPNDRRPLHCYPGVGHLLRRIGAARCYPVAIRIEYGGEQRPDAFISIGPVHELCVAADSRPRDLTACLVADLTAELDQLRDDVLAGNPAGFVTLLYGRRSMNRLYDAMLLRCPDVDRAR